MMEQYLKQLNKKSRGQHFMWMDRINVYNSQELPDNVDMDEVLGEVEEKIPPFFFSNIESIYIGDFKSLKDRHMDAMYQDGAIYIRPKSVFDEDDLIDDIVHEISHSMEETHAIDIYGDGQVEREFILKRMQLLASLESEGNSTISKDYFLNTSYSKEFDDFLYKDVGYPLLASLSVNIFASPYGATSLREYFANAFEKYFMGDHEEIRNISPQAYNKIENLIQLGEENEYGTI